MVKKPLPLVDQDPVFIAAPLMVPLRTIGNELHAVKFIPAFTMGFGVINKFSVSLTAGQAPLLMVFNTSVTVPAVSSAALGV